MFCSTSLTESSTDSQTMSRQIVLNTRHNLPLGLNIGKKLGSYGPKEKLTHFHCQILAGLLVLACECKLSVFCVLGLVHR